MRPKRTATALITSLVVGAALVVSASPAAHAVADTSAPVLDSLTRTSASTVGGDAAVSLHLTGHDAGGSHFVTWWVDFEEVATGTAFRVRNDLNGLGLDVVDDTGTAPTPHWLASGTYRATQVSLADGAFNGAQFNRDSTVTQGGVVTGSHAVDLAALDFTVANPASDTTPPTLSDVALLSNAVTAGDPAVLTYSAHDTGSGVASVWLLYQAPGPSGGTRLVSLNSPSDSSLTSVGPATGVVNKGFPGGAYQLNLLQVSDRAGNVTTYETGGVTTEPSGLVAPAALDLGPLALTVVQPGSADSTGPVLNGISMLTPTGRHPGESVVLSVDVRDAQSPITSVTVHAEDNDGRRVSVDQRCGDFAHGRLKLWLASDTPSGTWHIADLVTEDAAGNLAFYRADGTGEGTDGAPITGPQFTSLGFTVSPGAIRADAFPNPPTCGEPVVSLRSSSPYAVAGGTVVLSGRVTLSGLGVPSPLVAVYRTSGPSTTLLGISRGSTTGSFTRSVAVPATGGFRVQFLGSGRVADPATAFSTSARVTVGRASRVTVRDTSIRVPKGATRALVAHVGPKRAGVKVTLWRKSGSTWRVVSVRTSSATGAVRFSVGRPPSARHYRWTTGYAAGYLPAVSPTVRVSRR